MLFFLLALWTYDRYGRRGGAGRYALVATLFAIGLMAKPQIITLPFVLLLWDYWPLRRMFAKGPAESPSLPGRSFLFLVAEKIPLFVIAFAGSILTVMAQRSADAVRSLADYSLSVRLENAIVSYARYLQNFVWPRHLTPLYPHPENSLTRWQIGASLFVIIAVTALALKFRERRYLVLGWFWFLGVLVPMIGIVQVGEQAMADRFEYIPFVGLAIAIVWAGFEFAQERNISLKSVAIPAAVVVLIFGVLTYRQVGYWKDGITLFRYTLSVTDKNYLAHQSLGMALDNAHRVEEAIPEFRAAEALHQFPLPQVLNLGVYEQGNGHVEGALELYEKVARTSSDPQLRSSAFSQIGLADVDLKKYDQAEDAYDSALQINPQDAGALMGAGLVAEHNGDTDRATDLLSRSSKAHPSDIGFLLLAEALRRDQRPVDARKAEDLARSISPDLGQAAKKASQMLALFGCIPSQELSGISALLQ
jgi:tetratricopeptide (TPR) repeat protein